MTCEEVTLIILASRAFFACFWSYMQILVSQPGMEPMPPAVEVRWTTRGVPGTTFKWSEYSPGLTCIHSLVHSFIHLGDMYWATQQWQSLFRSRPVLRSPHSGGKGRQETSTLSHEKKGKMRKQSRKWERGCVSSDKVGGDWYSTDHKLQRMGTL